ncbi:hypothetical protein HELRODRAFT_160748 [Helobdella robusta]|uniref:Apple domain-containing protein n=1 Tax=Helobdella robusta TaxID=6412 RepID=T1EQN8_HELRO|nr:hypothetical protein HELRODRAFT_160748 [Helobdella robusta]ESO06566.1 hypothetical protein HELRODRAFT_160748 [Helobdella robusta]
MFHRIYIHALLCFSFMIFNAYAKCFTTFKRDGKHFCACGSSFESSSFPMFSSVEAFMFCSMKCSQSTSCAAYNFFIASNNCQLFNRTVETFAAIPNCQYYSEIEAPVMKLTLLITVDDELTEFYINGNSVPVALNFPNAKDWRLLDMYELTGAIYVLAIKSFNALGGPGGLIAKSSDNYILTNSSWKCTNNSYDGWYEVDYDDSFWSDAVVGRRERDNIHVMPGFKPAFWIIDYTDNNYSGYFYCRKSFTSE